MAFDFTIPEHPSKSFLDKEDIHFFYYDIGIFNLSGLPVNDIWESIIEEYKDKINIEIYDIMYIPQSIDLNTIIFNVQDKETVINAFFRHLRNAFSHNSIHRENDIFYITDQNNNHKITMRGKIKADLLKEFCLRFIEISIEIENKYQDSINLIPN